MESPQAWTSTREPEFVKQAGARTGATAGELAAPTMIAPESRLVRVTVIWPLPAASTTITPARVMSDITANSNGKRSTGTYPNCAQLQVFGQGPARVG